MISFKEFIENGSKMPELNEATRIKDFTDEDFVTVSDIWMILSKKVPHVPFTKVHKNQPLKYIRISSDDGRAQKSLNLPKFEIEVSESVMKLEMLDTTLYSNEFGDMGIVLKELHDNRFLIMKQFEKYKEILRKYH